MKRCAAFILTFILLFTAGCGRRTPAPAANTPAPAVSGTAEPETAPEVTAPETEPVSDAVDPEDTARRAALLGELLSLSADDALYARLCDLNGDRLNDILLLGRVISLLPTGEWSTNVLFSAIVWNGETAERVSLDKSQFPVVFGTDSYRVYRDRATGVTYAAYRMEQDGTVQLAFESAEECVTKGYRYDYESAEGLEDREVKAAELQAEIDSRFDLMEEITFPEQDRGTWSLDEAFLWEQYWRGYGDRPALPPFYSTVADVRAALGDGDSDLPFAPAELHLWFSSGVGGWGTELTLSPDGSFRGEFHDSEMGDSGEDYPYGTVYCSRFSGRFAVNGNDGTAWSLTMTELTLEDEPGVESISDGMRMVASEPYGLTGGSEFTLFVPETPVSGLDEEFLSWKNSPFGDVLGSFGLRCDADSCGFFAS